MKKHWFSIPILIIIATWLRFYQLNTPLADWHSWRQADTASVSREFVKHDYPIWEPHYQDLSNIPSGLNNPQGYRMVEFPLVNYLVASLVKAQPQLELVMVSRLVSISFSILGLVSLYGFIYLLTKHRVLAFLSGLMFATLPYSVFYSRVVLPEPAMIGTQLASLWLFLLWLQRTNKNKASSILIFLSSLIFMAISLLLKPTAIFIAPIFILLGVSYLGLRAFFSPWIISYALLSLAPLIWWRSWINQFPAGIPASAWLLNGNDIRLRPAWWRWLFAERIAKLILGYWGIPLFFVGLVGKIKTNLKQTSLFDWVTIVWAGSMFAYLVIFATGNVQHDYYQTILIPLVSILLARGIVWLIELPAVRKAILWPSLIVVVGLTFFMSWWEIRGFYNINNPNIVKAGIRVDQLTPPEAKVIAPYQGDTAFLFQTNRTGWPIGFEIKDKIALGANYYVSVNFDDETNQLIDQYQVVEQTKDYVIIKL